LLGEILLRSRYQTFYMRICVTNRMANKGRIGINVAVVVGLVAVFLILSTGLVSAQPSVTMDFESDYDDEQQTELTGREISIDGSINIEDEIIVDPTITVSPGEQMVIDQETFSVFVEGETGIELNDRPTGEGVVVTADADEIPADTTITMNFAAYSRGTNETNITSANVRIDYETAGGTSESVEREIPATLDGWPQETIRNLKDRIEDLKERGSGGLPWLRIVIGIVGLIVGLVVLLLIYDQFFRDI